MASDLRMITRCSSPTPRLYKNLLGTTFANLPQEVPEVLRDGAGPLEGGDVWHPRTTTAAPAAGLASTTTTAAPASAAN